MLARRSSWAFAQRKLKARNIDRATRRHLSFALVIVILIVLTWSSLCGSRTTSNNLLATGFLTFSDIGEYGRLGNQMFQIAATIGIAERNGLAWVFPAHVRNTTVGKLFAITGRQVDHLIHHQYSEKAGIFYDILIRPPTGMGTSMKGYFQSPRYFERSTMSLKSVFGVQSRYIREVIRYVPEIVEENSVTVHVRRGDYSKLGHLYNLVGVNYYLHALSILKTIDVVIIVSDDLAWCKRHLGPKLQEKVVYSPFKDEKLDFVLLYLGRHTIIANSSFSWWSAYLKKILKEEKMRGEVIAPRPWYNLSGSYAHLNTPDFYPPTWTVIDN